MARGDAEHASQHAHGVEYHDDPPAPQTVEQRLAALEAKVAKIEAAAKRAQEAKKAEAPPKGKAA